MKIEELAYDKYKKPSSQAAIKSGRNRGSRLPEKSGEWTCMSGYNCYARQQEKAINFEWAKQLISIGFRVGKLDYEGCTNFYIYMPFKSEK